jgi:hypothetical protein
LIPKYREKGDLSKSPSNSRALVHDILRALSLQRELRISSAEQYTKSVSKTYTPEKVKSQFVVEKNLLNVYI